MVATLLHQALDESAARGPDRVAVIHNKERIAYGTLADRVARLAAGLRGRGVRAGDRVALLIENSIAYVAAYYAVLRAGAVAVPFHPQTAGPYLARALGRCGAAAAIAALARLDVLRSVRAEVPSLGMIATDRRTDGSMGGRMDGVGADGGDSIPSLADLEAEGESAPPPTNRSETDLASIIFTSGSTGQPRGVMLSHLNLLSNTRSIVEYLRLTPDDRVLAVLPFPYVYGKSLLNTHVLAGGCVVIDNRFTFPNVVLDTLAREEATGFAGVPSTFAILLHQSALRSRRFPRLRYVTQAGGPLAPALGREIMDALPGAKLYCMYGATEASARLTYLDPAELPRRLGSIGKAIPGVEIAVLRDDGRPVAPGKIRTGEAQTGEAQTGEVGEIVARGPNIMLGYWGEPEETARVLTPEGFRTGDFARIDEDGFLYHAGRKTEMIKMGAYRVSPIEIEEALLEYPGVHMAAVVGTPDEILGEAIVAFVAPREKTSLQPAELAAHCRARLSEFKVPQRIEVLAELPRSAAGKIDKLDLKERALAGAPRNTRAAPTGA